MGLDTVELIMEVEDTFNIQIDDRDAEAIQTAGDLYRYVTSRMGARPAVLPTGSCASAHAFYRVRAAMIDSGVMARREVRLDSDLSDWANAIPGTWHFFLRSLGLKPKQPALSLQRHRVLSFSNASAVIASIMLMIVMAWTRSPLFVMLFTAAITAACLITAHLSNRLPPYCGDVRGFVKHYELDLTPPLHVDEVWARLRRIIAETAGVDPATINGNTHFIYDLELG